MLRWRPALGLGLCLLAGTSLWALWAYVRNWPPVSYVPYYLPCPEIFNLKLQHKGEEPLQPVAQPLYPQPKLLEQRRLEEQMIPAHGVSPGSSRRAPCWCQLRSSLSCCEVAGATPLSTWGTRDPEAGTGLPPVTQHKRRVRTWPRLPPREALSTGTSPATRPTELLTLTPWLAPIISEGTFNPELLQLIYQPLNLTIGVTVFAVGKSYHWDPDGARGLRHRPDDEWPLRGQATHARSLYPASTTHVPFPLPPTCFSAPFFQLSLSGAACKMSTPVGIYENITRLLENIGTCSTPSLSSTSWTRPRSSSCVATACTTTSSPTTLQPFPGSRWALAGCSASSPSGVTLTGRRFPHAGWRPSACT
ncbi:globoside alpha-1,3-N-acetylgalactosaminyltransferase 1 isoform X3 [Ictidomys tridecemlineatus]